MTVSDVSHYYDELHRWTAREQSFQTFSGLDRDAIHRFLIDSDTGAFSPDTIYKFIDPHLRALAPLRGLDAGCGYGGTIFRCHGIHGGRWTGITISEQQLSRAKEIAAARGLAGAIDLRLLSYDALLPGRYNVIVAIESLVHSTRPAGTLRNLASALEPGGRLIVIDDMPIEPANRPDRALLAQFKRAWRCPVAPSAATWIALAEACGLHPLQSRDLSHLMKPRPERDLDAALLDLTAQRAEKSRLGFARLSDAEIGGLHLERLLGRGIVRYVMLVFEK